MSEQGVVLSRETLEALVDVAGMIRDSYLGDHPAVPLWHTFVGLAKADLARAEQPAPKESDEDEDESSAMDFTLSCCVCGKPIGPRINTCLWRGTLFCLECFEAIKQLGKEEGGDSDRYRARGKTIQRLQRKVAHYREAYKLARAGLRVRPDRVWLIGEAVQPAPAEPAGEAKSSPTKGGDDHGGSLGHPARADVTSAASSAPGAAEITCGTCEHLPALLLGPKNAMCSFCTRFQGPERMEGDLPIEDHWNPHPSPPPAASEGECPHYSCEDGRHPCAWVEGQWSESGMCFNCLFPGEDDLQARTECAFRSWEGLMVERDRLRKRVGELQEQVEFCSSNETDRQRNRAEAAEADLGVALRDRDRLREEIERERELCAENVAGALWIAGECRKREKELAAEKQRAEQAERTLAANRKRDARAISKLGGRPAFDGLEITCDNLIRRAEQAEADNLTLHAALADAELLKQQYAERAEQAEARAKAAEDAAKGCFRLEPFVDPADMAGTLRSVADIPAVKNPASPEGRSLQSYQLLGLAFTIEHGPEGGEGWWVPREQVEKALDSMAPARAEGPAGLWRSAAVSFASKLGIPIDLLAPKPEEGSDE